MPQPETVQSDPTRAPYGEADTRAKLIDPALYSQGWGEEHIRREETAGGIEIVEGVARRQSRGRVDYTLRIRVTTPAQPVALAYVEAKAENKPPTAGLQQVKGYAAASKRLNVPFVYSTNGHLFIEYDAFTGQTSQPRPLALFPSPEDLRRRYELGKGFALDSEAARPLLIPYPGGEATRRYYQDAAIRATLEAVACGRNRVLLSLATGAGKTFIAVNLLKRLTDAGQMRRALFICDRDELRTQALGAFSNVFGSDAAEVFQLPDGKNNARNAKIHIATYQTLDTDSKEARNFFFKHYLETNTFSHIIIDECHRSAWGEWKFILDHNPDAIQIGLTATPRQLILGKQACDARQEYADPVSADEKLIRDNFEYFGEPVYEYTLAQGIEDGYLAPPEIFTFDLFHDGKAVPERKQTVKRGDLEGKQLTNSVTGVAVTTAQVKEEYNQTELDERLLMKERVEEMSRNLFDQFLAHGGTPEQKTIAFCASDRHADAIATALNGLYQDWCATHGQDPKAFYAFKCTAKVDGSDMVKDLRGSASSHFIACTVELLSTGVDVPCVRNLAFLQYVRSPIVFYQMLGRGTRIDPDTEKLMFRVYDYTDATSLLGKEFKTKYKPTGGGGPGPTPPPADPPVLVEGVQILIASTGRWLTAMIDGRHSRITVEEYRERVAERLVASASTIDQFRVVWVQPPERRGLINDIVLAGFPPRALQVAEEAEDCDLYDVLGEVGYGLNRMTKANRAFAFTYKHRPWLEAMPTDAAATVRAIASQFSRGGTESLETPHIFQTPEVRKAGGLEALAVLGDPALVLMDTKERLFAA